MAIYTSVKNAPAPDKAFISLETWNSKRFTMFFTSWSTNWKLFPIETDGPTPIVELVPCDKPPVVAFDTPLLLDCDSLLPSEELLPSVWPTEVPLLSECVSEIPFPWLIPYPFD